MEFSQESKRLLLCAEVEESLSSATRSFLPKPSLDVAHLVENVRKSIDLQPDTRVLLEDGEFLKNADTLKGSCAHFKDMLSSDFQEGRRERPMYDAMKEIVGSESESTIEELDVLSGYDSDFDRVGAASPNRQGIPELKEVKLHHFSSATFKAFMLYTQTGTVTFKPLRSSTGSIHMPNAVLLQSVEKDGWSCSPKSLYEMADYLDVPPLKELCKAAYLAMIQPGNLLHELSHRFARLHKPFSAALESYALKHWSEISATATFGADVQAVMDHEESRMVFTSILKQLPGKA